MSDPLDTDRLVWGGSLYPPPDIPVSRARGLTLLLAILACAAIWIVGVSVLL